MIIIISSAKTLNPIEIEADLVKQLSNLYHNPQFDEYSFQLVSLLKNLSLKELTKLLQVNDSIAKTNFERYQKYGQPDNTRYPSVLFYRGDVYKALELKKYHYKNFEYLQNHLRIISGLYGILKPFDLIYPYRLEMSTILEGKIKVNGKFIEFSNLYELWNHIITNFIQKELSNHSQKILINLASNEYARVITDNFTYPRLNIYFQEKKNGRYVTLGMNAKRARGKMLNWMALHLVDQLEDIKKFSVDGYQFSKEKSSEWDWYFLKK